MTQEYEKRQPIYRPAEEVFEWLSKVENLPHYLPPVKESWSEGPAAAGKPGERIKMKVEVPGRYETEGEDTSMPMRKPAGSSGGRSSQETIPAGLR